MAINELISERDADIYSVYISGLEQGLLTSVRQAAGYVACHSAKRFYISARNASLMIGRIRKGLPLGEIQEGALRRIMRLNDDYNEYMGSHPGCTLSREQVLEILVERPAPEFYLSRRAVRSILRKEIYKRKVIWAG